MRELFSNPSHPYTKGLLATLPKFGEEGELTTISGMVPRAGSFPAGCVFCTRCPHATERCKAEKPGFYTVGGEHKVRCFRYEKEEA